jgi:hypothetical protein
MKPTHEMLQSGADWRGGLAGRPPLGPTAQLPLHTDSSCQLHSQSYTYFGEIPNFIVIS